MEVKVRNKDQIGLALKRFRLENELTQTQLSLDSRIDQGIISKIESGSRAPELKTLFHLCSVLGVDLILRSRDSK